MRAKYSFFWFKTFLPFIFVLYMAKEHSTPSPTSLQLILLTLIFLFHTICFGVGEIIYAISNKEK